MTEEPRQGAFDPNAVRRVLEIEAPQAVAWRVFTEGMGGWWPLATHKIGAVPAVDAVIEPQAGGRWFERGDDGSTCTWGSVLVWEPPARLVLSWDITADWAYDPSLKTEVEARFVEIGPGRTRLELEHRRLDRFGDRRDEMRGIFDSDGGWGGMLVDFARVAARTA